MNCASGGKKIESGVDADDSGALNGGEVAATNYVCDGAGGGSGTLYFTRSLNFAGFVSPEYAQLNGATLSPNDANCTTAATGCVNTFIPRACTLKNLYVQSQDALGQTVAVTVRYAAPNSLSYTDGPSCSLASGAGNTCTDTSTSVALMQGSVIELRTTWTGTLASPAKFYVSVECQ
jgi:hypothetical protein